MLVQGEDRPDLGLLGSAASTNHLVEGRLAHGLEAHNHEAVLLEAEIATSAKLREGGEHAKILSGDEFFDLDKLTLLSKLRASHIELAAHLI